MCVIGRVCKREEDSGMRDCEKWKKDRKRGVCVCVTKSYKLSYYDHFASVCSLTIALIANFSQASCPIQLKFHRNDP